MAGPPLGRSGSINKANMLAADDAKRMQALEGKVAEQKKELENRDITIRAIQRNFEQLSSMCQADKERSSNLIAISSLVPSASYRLALVKQQQRSDTGQAWRCDGSVFY
jgi:hypothetical protein